MIKPLTIGIDIDATITEAYYWIPWANAYFGRSIKPEQVTDYEVHRVLGISEEEYLAFYDRLGEVLHKESSIRPGAVEVLKQLYSRHQLHYITARHQQMERVTKEWFHRHDVSGHGLHLLGTHHKVEKAHELGCDLFIEDRYENAQAIAESGIDVLLMDCFYNQDLPLHEQVKRIDNWQDVSRHVRKLERQAA